jgi:hypothetical protein
MFLNNYFIDKSINEAKSDRLDNAFFYLSVASKINTFGEYGRYWNLLPSDFSKQIKIPQDTKLRSDIQNYITSLEPKNIKDDEDQGLSFIYYNLGLISYKNNFLDLTPELFKMAVYNYPEFPSFHAELINYYYVQGQPESALKINDYCHKFKQAAIFCDKYMNDIVKFKTPQIVGYMELPIASHYLSQ